MSDIKTFMTAAAGIIVRKNEDGSDAVLLIQRSKNDVFPSHWEFPRGKCDRPVGENPTHCAKREIKEETGLDVEIGENLGTYEYIADKGTRLTRCYIFKCLMKNNNKQVKLSKEHSNFQWVSELGMANLMILPDQKKFLEKVLSQDNTIVSTPTNNFTPSMKLTEIYLEYLYDSIKD